MFVAMFLVKLVGSVEFDMDQVLADASDSAPGLPKFFKLNIYKGFSSNLSFPKNSLIIFDEWKDANVSFFGRKLRTNEVTYEKFGPYSHYSELRGIYWPSFNFSLEINSTALEENTFSFSVFTIPESYEQIYISTKAASETIEISSNTIILSPITQKKNIKISYDGAFNVLTRDKEAKQENSYEYEGSKEYDIMQFNFDNVTRKHKITCEQEASTSSNTYDIQRFIDPSTFPLLFSNEHIKVRTVMLGVIVAWTIGILLVSVAAFIVIVRNISV